MERHVQSGVAPIIALEAVVEASLHPTLERSIRFNSGNNSENGLKDQSKLIFVSAYSRVLDFLNRLLLEIRIATERHSSGQQPSILKLLPTV